MYLSIITMHCAHIKMWTLLYQIISPYNKKTQQSPPGFCDSMIMVNSVGFANLMIRMDFVTSLESIKISQLLRKLWPFKNCALILCAGFFYERRFQHCDLYYNAQKSAWHSVSQRRFCHFWVHSFLFLSTDFAILQCGTVGVWL